MRLRPADILKCCLFYVWNPDCWYSALESHTYGAVHGRAAVTDQVGVNGSKNLGMVWIRCSWPVVAVGLTQVLNKEAEVYYGLKAPDNAPRFIIICMDSIAEDLPEMVDRLQEQHPRATIIAFGLRLDLALAQAALQSGAQGFVHAGMQPRQIIRALQVASEGELVAPRQLLEYFIVEGNSAGVTALSARQREILDLVAKGLSNAQIAQQLYLSESTVKQHLRATYKLLGVKNRTEAAKLLREANQ